MRVFWISVLVSLETRANHSLRSGLTNSAAAEVAARISATKSAIVKSISCPIALIVGIVLAKIARATISSLNAHKSSKEPPPRVISNHLTFAS